MVNTQNLQEFAFENMDIINDVASLTGNFIHGTAGNDNLSGTTGDDTIVGAAGNDYINGNMGDDSIEGGIGVDTIYGGAGNDTINGGDIPYDGNDSNDYIDGGIGNDLMQGGNGNDTYVVSDTGDVVDEIAGNGNDTVISTIRTYTLPSNIENLLLNYTGAGAIGYGNELNNLMQGDDYRNDLYGLAGNDTIFGLAGNDEISGDAGDDILLGCDNTNTTADGNDTIYGGAGNDQISGENGNDVLFGEAGNDYILGGNGNDSLFGGSGTDSLLGGAGDDTYRVGANDEITVIQDASGTDTIAFDSTVNKNNIAIFMDSSNNLFFDYGTTSGAAQIGILDQVNTGIESLSANGYIMTNSSLNQLVQDITAYASENGITLTSAGDVRANADLMELVNSAWTAA